MTPAPADVKTPGGSDTMHHTSQSLRSFRFVCTNLAVGGGGVFAGGFMSIHAGEIPVDQITAQLGDYLRRFEQIVGVYRHWHDQPLDHERFATAMELVPVRARRRIVERAADATTVFAAYNAATWHATHGMRSARSAFDLLALINARFQQFFSLN